MIVVADASPLIFLAKIGQLDLIHRLFPGTVLIPHGVHRELLASPITPAEEQGLLGFIKSCRVVHVSRPRHYATALSKPDNEVLTLASRRRATRVLSDDRLLRQLAATEGLRPMGTLGLLLRAMEKGLAAQAQTRQRVEQLIQQHQFRISIEVYDAMLQRIEAFRER